jgi:hypothetical protein
MLRLPAVPGLPHDAQLKPDGAAGGDKETAVRWFQNHHPARRTFSRSNHRKRPVAAHLLLDHQVKDHVARGFAAVFLQRRHQGIEGCHRPLVIARPARIDRVGTPTWCERTAHSRTWGHDVDMGIEQQRSRGPRPLPDNTQLEAPFVFDPGER